MAERSGFFPYVSGDSNSEYDSAFLARWVASFISNGTYDGELAVTADTNMQVKLPAGRAWINGYYYCNDGNLALAVANADGVLNRKDTVVLRWNINTRNITVQVLKGTPASTATAPVITRTAEQYDLKLAEISIPAGTTAITQSLITDTRLDNSVCGIVHAVVDHLDTSTFYNQIQNDLANFKSGSETDFNTWKNKFQSDLVNWKSTSESDYSTWSTEQKTAFDAWLQSIKDVLDADTAGHLQTEIDGKAEKTHASTHATGGSDPMKPEDIGAAWTPSSVTVTLPTSGWALNSTSKCYEQTVDVANLLTSDSTKTVTIWPHGSTDPAAQLLTDAAYAKIFTQGGYVACNENGKLYCRGPVGGEKPQVDFQVDVVFHR